jgi:hypothetical protein
MLVIRSPSQRTRVSKEEISNKISEKMVRESILSMVAEEEEGLSLVETEVEEGAEGGTEEEEAEVT